MKPTLPNLVSFERRAATTERDCAHHLKKIFTNAFNTKKEDKTITFEKNRLNVSKLVKQKRENCYQI